MQPPRSAAFGSSDGSVTWMYHRGWTGWVGFLGPPRLDKKGVLAVFFFFFVVVVVVLVREIFFCWGGTKKLRVCRIMVILLYCIHMFEKYIFFLNITLL